MTNPVIVENDPRFEIFKIFMSGVGDFLAIEIDLYGAHVPLWVIMVFPAVAVSVYKIVTNIWVGGIGSEIYSKTNSAMDKKAYETIKRRNRIKEIDKKSD